ncbi:MAG: hypothetical protein M0Z80_04415 [Treponema sp.]|nr:hypothetical protein [Treponema sp.]
MRFSTGGGGRPGRAAALLAALLAFSVVQARAQEVGAWFGRPSASTYSGIRAEVESLAASASAQGVPERLFVRRLAEGAEKRIPPERLVAALREDARRFAEVALMLGERSLLPPESERAGELIWQGSLLLRAGSRSADLAAALDAVASGAAKAGAGGAFAQAQRAEDSLAAAIALEARFHFASSSVGRLAAAIARSRLERGIFASLVSVFARAAASGLSADAAADSVIRVLDAGGSLDALEREIQRRTRYR